MNGNFETNSTLTTRTTLWMFASGFCSGAAGYTVQDKFLGNATATAACHGFKDPEELAEFWFTLANYYLNSGVIGLTPDAITEENRSAPTGKPIEFSLYRLADDTWDEMNWV